MSAHSDIGSLCALAALAVACEAPPSSPTGVPGVTVSSLSRSAAPEPPVRTVPSLGASANDVARKEILAHVPSAHVAEAKSQLGTDTGEAEPDGGSAVSPIAPDAGSGVEAHVSMVNRPTRSAPSVEKLLRATVYFQLVNRCRDLQNAILPPEAIVLGFEIDAGGSIVDGTITAEAKSPKHELAAECMIRELAASGFRAPSATQGESTTVTMPVPSVD